MKSAVALLWELFGVVSCQGTHHTMHQRPLRRAWSMGSRTDFWLISPGMARLIVQFALRANCICWGNHYTPRCLSIKLKVYVVIMHAEVTPRRPKTLYVSKRLRTVFRILTALDSWALLWHYIRLELAMQAPCQLESVSRKISTCSLIAKRCASSKSIHLSALCLPVYLQCI